MKLPLPPIRSQLTPSHIRATELPTMAGNASWLALDPVALGAPRIPVPPRMVGRVLMTLPASCDEVKTWADGDDVLIMNVAPGAEATAGSTIVSTP